jgi:YD repeat-containing protein
MTQGDEAPWRYEYDARGNLLKATDPLQGVTETWVDQHGRVTGGKSPRGYVSLKFYDAFGQLTVERDANGNDVGHGYDLFGRRVAKTDGRGMVSGAAGDYTTRYQYDNRDRLVSVKQAQGWHLANDDALIYRQERIARGRAGLMPRWPTST